MLLNQIVQSSNRTTFLSAIFTGGQNFVSGEQNFVSGGQNFVSGGQSFATGVKILLGGVKFLLVWGQIRNLKKINFFQKDIFQI